MSSDVNAATISDTPTFYLTPPPTFLLFSFLSFSLSLSQSPLQVNKYTLNIIGEFSRTIVITLQRRIIETRGV